MNTQVKKWTPFLIIIFIILISLVYLFYGNKTSDYMPQTDNPAVIYRQACLGCHGQNGRGSEFLYPNLVEEKLTPEKIEKFVTEGELLMPAFPHIQGDTLDGLVNYIQRQKYLGARETSQ